MKRIVSNEIGLGLSAAVPTLIIVALTGAGVTVTFLLGLAFLTIGVMINEPPPRIERWRERRGRG